MSPEFLRLNAAGPELRWLDEWLQQGTLYAKSVERPRWPTLIAEAKPWRFIYVPPKEGRFVIGVIVASQDKVGRAFPFLSFVLLDRVIQPWLIPVASAGFLEQAAASLSALRASLDWNEFCRQHERGAIQESNLVAAAEITKRFLSTTTIERWWSKTFGDADDQREHAGAQELQNMMGFAKREVEMQGQQGITFPLFLQGAQHNSDVAFWLEASFRAPEMGNRSYAGFVCFWGIEATEAGRSALLSIGPGSPNVVRYIMAPEAQDEGWCAVGVSSLDCAGGDRALNWNERQQCNSGKSLLELLDVLYDVKRRDPHFS
jgi:type VI secretion system ImpM family protein